MTRTAPAKAGAGPAPHLIISCTIHVQADFVPKPWYKFGGQDTKTPRIYLYNHISGLVQNLVQNLYQGLGPFPLKRTLENYELAGNHTHSSAQHTCSEPPSDDGMSTPGNALRDQQSGLVSFSGSGVWVCRMGRGLGMSTPQVAGNGCRVRNMGTVEQASGISSTVFGVRGVQALLFRKESCQKTITHWSIRHDHHRVSNGERPRGGWTGPSAT